MQQLVLATISKKMKRTQNNIYGNNTGTDVRKSSSRTDIFWKVHMDANYDPYYYHMVCTLWKILVTVIHLKMT